MVIWVCDFLDGWVDPDGFWDLSRLWHEALDAFAMGTKAAVSARIKRVPNWFRLESSEFLMRSGFHDSCQDARLERSASISARFRSIPHR